MVLELVDFIRMQHVPTLWLWWVTLAVWLGTVMLFCWAFKAEKHLWLRVTSFALASSFFILTLVFDTRLLFLPLFLIVWKSKGWTRLLVAIISITIITDGFLLILYSLYAERDMRHFMVAGVLVFLVLVGLNHLYASPLPHILASLQQGPLMEVVTFEVPPTSQFDFISKMYSPEWWGTAGIGLSIWATACGAFMWLQRDPLCCLFTTGIIIMTILNITLVADLWRYFGPQMMIFFGTFSPWKVVRRE